MGPLEACLFDLDGVIVDTAKYHYLAWKRLAQELGFEFTLEQNEQLKGVSRMRSLEILLQIGDIHVSNEQMEEMAVRKNAWYVEYISHMTPQEVLPGAKAFLETVRQAKIKTALGSASKNAMMILNNVGLVEYFDVIIDGTKTSTAKPDPEVFLLCASELGVNAANCVVFEDAQAGVEAAIRASMHCVGIGSKTTLAKANVVLASLADASLDHLLFS